VYLLYSNKLIEKFIKMLSLLNKMLDDKTNQELQPPVPFQGMGLLGIIEFLTGHFKAELLSDAERKFMDTFLAKAIEAYKSKDYAEADKKVIRGWCEFRKAHSQHLEGQREDLEADAVYFSYLTRKALSEGINPRAIHNTQLLNIHPYGYFIRCSTYIMLTRDLPFARRLESVTLEAVLSYADIHKPGFSADFMHQDAHPL
jgi:hypothetical protein